MPKKHYSHKPVSLDNLPKHIQERLAEHDKIQKDFLRLNPHNLIILLGSVGKIPSLS